HLLHEVRRERLSGGPVKKVRRVDAVDQEAIVGAACAVDLDAAVPRFVGDGGDGREQPGEIASLRNALDDLRLHVSAGRVLLHVDQRRFRCNLHGFGDRFYDENQIDLQYLTELEPYIGSLGRLEALQSRGDLVAARRQ